MTPATSSSSRRTATGSRLFGKENRTPATFYATPELSQRLKLIHHLIQHSEQLLLILADLDHGKTCLLQQVAEQAEEHWKILRVHGEPSQRADKLLASLLTDFNVRSDGKTLDTLRETLRSHIAATRYNGQLPVLLVDDAHMLPLDALKQLIELAMSGETQTRLRVLLFCEPQITSLFAAPEFAIMRNTLIHTLDIPRFNEKQVREYLQFLVAQHRASNAQIGVDNPFSGMTVQRFYGESAGVPGRVKQLAETVLGDLPNNPPLPSSTAAPHTPRADTAVKPRPLLRGLGLLLLFLALVVGAASLKRWLYQEPTPDVPPAPLPEARPLPLPPSPLSDLPLPQGLSDDEMRVEPPVPVAPLAIVPVPTAPAAVNPTVPPVAPPAPPEALDASAIAGVKSEAWLRRQAPEAYTIQLLGSHTVAGVQQFILQHQLQGPLAMFLTRYRERDWYVLTYGVYTSNDEARTALDALPLSLRNSTSKPWLRSLRSVHSSLAGVTPP